MKLPTCVIFDFDGVVADTEQGRYQLLDTLLAPYGIEFSHTLSIDQLIGLHTTSVLRTHFAHLGEEAIRKIARERFNLFYAQLNKYCLLYPGAAEAIASLTQRYDVKMATANSHANITRILEHFGLLQHFSHVYGLEDLDDKGRKNYTRILGHLPYKPSDCWVIEDSVVGISSAKEAGFTTVLFNHYHNPEAMQYADHTVQHYHELLALLA